MTLRNDEIIILIINTTTTTNNNNDNDNGNNNDNTNNDKNNISCPALRANRSVNYDKTTSSFYESFIFYYLP